MNLTYYPFLKKITQIFNLTATATFPVAGSLFDTLIVDKYLGKAFPEKFTEDDLQNLQHLHNWYNNLKYSGMASRLVNSHKFSKVIKEFDNRINNNSYPLKWSFLSAHDTDVLPAQTDLNFSSFECIE